MPTGNTQQVINYGASANDGQGDPLRTAFIKTDENFDNIWLAGPAGSNVRITDNTISAIDTNGNLILSPNGIGVIQTNNTLVPRANRSYDLGSANLQYRTVYANSATFQTLSLPGDLTVGGNLTVQGNIIQVGNIVTETLTIQLANAATTGNAANGSGITVGASDNIATLLYNATSNTWTTNIGANISGNVTAPYFIGNGSQLTGLAPTYGNANVATFLAGFGSNTVSTTGNITGGFIFGNISLANGFPAMYANANAVAYGESGWAGNIIPSGNAVYSLGNATNQWNDLYVSNATIFMNNVPISLGAGNVLTVNGNAVLQNNSNSTISTTGNITADYFIGDGSQLTGLSTSSISNGLSNVAIPTANGNVTVTANGTYTWSFEDTGTLIFPASPNGQIYGGLDNDFIITTANANAATYYFTFSQFGDLTVPINLNVSGNAYVSDIVGPGEGNVTVTANTQSWLFETDGRLFLPNSGVINASGNSVDIGSEDAISLEANTVVNIYTDTNGAGHQWQFGDAGELTLPASSQILEVANPGGFPGYAMALAPDVNNAIDADQQLLIYPTGGADANHLHLTSGNLYNTELFLGNDNLYVKLANTGNVVVNSNDDTGNSAQWTFGTSGNLTLPMGGVVYETNIPDGALSGSAIALKPTGGTNADQQLLIYPTVNDANHLHLTTGNLYNTELFLGDDNLYVKLANTGNVVINSNDDVGNTAQWTFNTFGTLTLPGGSRIRPLGANLDIFAGTGSYVNLITSDESTSVGVDGSGGYITTPGGTWDFDTTGNLTAPGNVSAVGNITGAYILGNGSQLTGLPATYGNANVVANLAALGSNPISSTGNITTTANISGNYILGNGSQLTGIAASYSNANVATFLAAYGSNTITTTGNITAGNLIGNISITGNVTGTSPNVTLVAGSYSYTFDNTGTLTLPAAASGNEGGEIAFTQAANSTLGGNTVVLDQYVDQIRFFEAGGSTRGAYIDITQAATGVGTLLNNRVSGIVNAGAFVTMDNLKATVTTSSDRGLSLATVSGTVAGYVSSSYSLVTGSPGGAAGSISLTTTPSSSIQGYNFTSEGDTAIYVVRDNTNNRVYRITMMIGGAYNNNFISIERLL